MNRTPGPEGAQGRDVAAAQTDPKLNGLQLAYKRAFDEYSEAAFVINDSIRRRIALSAEAFVRRRIAYVALLDASRAVCEARRGTPRGQQQTISPASAHRDGAAETT
jgi:hypothetical protein